MLGMELVTGRVTAPGATLTNVTPNTGNTLTIRNAPLDSDVRLIQLWGRNQAAGVLVVRSPRLHDNVQGLRFRIPLNSPIPLLGAVNWQKLVPQDNLVVQVSGSAVGGQIEHAALLIWYANLQGASARLFNYSDILPKIVNIVTVEVAIAPGVSGDYTGQVAITNNFDLLHANTDYALLGYHVDAQCTAVRVISPDFANLGLGGPGNLQLRHLTARWFVNLNQWLGIPTVPVFNSANKAGTLVDVVQDQAGAAVNVTLILAEIGGGAMAGAAAR